MAGNYNAIDAWFSEEGDFLIEMGDLKTTQSDLLRSLVQDIQSIAKYEAGSWRIDPNLGVAQHPLGNANSAKTAVTWEEDLMSAMSIGDIVDLEDLTLESFPVSYDTLFTMVTVDVVASNENEDRETVVVPTTISLKTHDVIYY